MPFNRLNCIVSAVALGLGLGVFTADAAEPERPRITGVAHVALYVHDVEKSRGFYKGLLGYGEPFSLTNTDGSLALTFIKINDRQYVELFPEQQAGGDRLNHISLETDDAEALRVYLAARGITVPPQVSKARIGNLNFNIHDPDGHTVEITQYTPDSWSVREKGKAMTDARLSLRMTHAGIVVTNLTAALHFYCDILGCKEFWRGSSNTNHLNWVNVKVPDGDDYIEFMLFPTAPPPGNRGGSHHICLESPDLDKTLAIVKERAAGAGYVRPLEMHTGINRKRQSNLYDPDGTRVEFMEPRTVDNGVPAPSSTAPFP